MFARHMESQIIANGQLLQSLGTFYAYGRGGAMPLFYADGQAYLGWTPPAGAKEATNVTCEACARRDQRSMLIFCSR